MNQKERKEGCGLKYRVVSILKDNRPRFLIISDIEEIEILPSKYLKHLDQINASPNTVKSAAFALSYYYNFLQEQTIGLDEITLLSYSEQNKHFIDFLYWVKSGKHTEHNTQTSNKTCNMYLGAVFRYYQFLALEDVLPMLKVLRVKKVSYFDSMGVNHQNAVNSFKGFFKEEEPNLEEITSEEIQELINACTNDRDRLLIAMMAETGLRLGEILGIHYTEDIDFERRTVRVRYREFNSNLARAKNAEYRMALLSNTTFPENKKDVWDMRKLDIVPRSNPIRGRYRLDFREIRQKEFKEIIKRILYSHCQTKAMGSIKGELRGFRRFASFMYDRFPEVKHFTEISRDMIEDYLVYIKTDTGLTSVSYTTELSVLDNLLDEIGRELEIENLCNLFLSSDCRAYDNALPEAYSDAEIRRFNSALTKLKPQLGRCLIIHQMLGTRIEDTLTLRRDCLSEKSGHYFITILQQKTRKYKRPVSDQLAELIRKAIEVSEKEHPDSEYIFLQDNGKLYTDSMLKYHVNIMIYENDIRDDNGNYFEFRTHRFRHTFGVKLTEMKLDDDSIARLLGHKDTRTIPHYRRLRNEALAEDTKAVRDEMNELLAQYRREKDNAETR